MQVVKIHIAFSENFFHYPPPRFERPCNVTPKLERRQSFKVHKTK